MLDLKELNYFDHELLALLYGNPPDYDSIEPYRKRKRKPKHVQVPVPVPAQAECNKAERR